MKLNQTIKFISIIVIFLITLSSIFSLGTQNTGFQTTSSYQEIDVHSECRNVAHTGVNSYFIPTNSANEWLQFRLNSPTGVSIDECDTTEEDLGVDCSSIPGDWIEVPGNSYFGTGDFCVMQFEAKDVSNVATSQPSGTPWVSINFTDARAACNQLNTQHSSFGGTFKMITNREWMTIARDAEQQDQNWDSGTVGSGSMYRGHSDGSPNNALAVSDIGDYYDGTGNSAPSIERRVLELSNGEIIWDLGGNVYEWVDMLEDGSSFDGNACSGASLSWSSYFGNDGENECNFNSPYSKDSAADTRYEMGPLGDYNADEGVGQIYSRDSTGRSLFRGGSWGDGRRVGPFTATLYSAPWRSLPPFGFRCSYNNSQQDTFPNAFSFTDQSDVATSSSITSNSLTPTGYDGPLSVSVNGDGSPQISINGGSWTTSTSMSPRDSIEVRLTSSSSYDTTSQATVDLGDYSTTWSVTTEEETVVYDPSCAFKDDKSGCESYYLTDTVDGINVVHDTILGLYWEQSPSTTERTWSNSKTHCSNLGSGWRLPTLVELEASLVDVGRASDPYIVGGSGGSNLFDNVQSSNYWTDTRYSIFRAYSVRFNDGRSSADFASFNFHYALCVKEDSNYDVIWNTTQQYSYFGGLGQERVGGEFIEDATKCGGSGTMYDTITNLCWEKNPSTSSYEYSEAQTHCSGVATAGGGWRLPDKAELMTLLYHDGPDSTDTRLDSMGFNGIQNSNYWSNTLYVSSSSDAYFVYFNDGGSFPSDVTDTSYALCVKTVS